MASRVGCSTRNPRSRSSASRRTGMRVAAADAALTQTCSLRNAANVPASAANAAGTIPRR